MVYNRVLRIATMSYNKDNCPLLSISLDNHLYFYYYTPTTQRLTLFNNCPLIPQLKATDVFDCSINASATNNYFWIDYKFETAPFPNLIQCQVKITVPVLRDLVANKSMLSLSLEEVLRNGFDVEYVSDISECKSCKSSGGQCGYDVKAGQPTCFCRDGRQYQGRCPTRPRNVKVIVGVVASVGGTLVIAAVGIIIFCRLRKKKANNPENLEAFLKTHGALALRRYKYSDIKKMTDSFQDKLGQGGFGSVYKGKLLDGRMVAVKVLTETKGNGNEFINEVASISRTSHVNIVALLGFCVEGSKRALIYEYVPNGSLEKFIYVENPLEADSHLGWETLYKIAIGIAHGLEYLHRGCYIRILHFDIKPHNILLDDEFNPKISDFGLAKLCVGKNSMVSMTGARGTAGYIAPEVVSRNFGGVSHKADVYSYGMMLLEMVGGRKNLNVRVTNLSEIYFPQWIYKRLNLNEDLGLYGVTTVEEEEIARKMILVGLWCIQMDPSDRPAMSKVLEMLEGSLQALQVPPKPFISSPAREEGQSSTTSIS